GEPSEIAVFVGCSHKVNDDGEHCSAGGLWYGPGDPRNSIIRVAKELSSRNAGQSAAVLYAIQNLPRETSIHFCLKSKRIISTLTTNLASCEDNGWADTEDRQLLKTITAALRGRGTRCTFREASEEDTANMHQALGLATQGLDEGEPTVLITEIPPSHDLKGIKLKGGSQHTFYSAIKATSPKPERLKTTVMLDITRHAARILSGNTPTDSQIWMSLRHPDITRTTRDFMWKCLHQAYKVGDYWRNIPNYEHYAKCPHCQVDESMEHILLECDTPGREKLWNLTQELWELKGYAWPEMDLGRIFACGLVDIRDTKGKRDGGAIRLFRILISETAHLIWKFRCTRVIDRGNDPSRFFSESELHNKWLYCINSRLKIDALLTDSKKYGNRALKISKVQNTWKGVLMDNQNLPDIWVRQSGFLVGIPPLRPPGRNQ
ncbi:ribonuclease H-like protein, partial [Mycena alexandri]